MFFFFKQESGYHKSAFVFTADTRNTDAASSTNSTQFKVPVVENAYYNMIAKSPSLPNPGINMEGQGNSISGIITFSSGGVHEIQLQPHELTGIGNFGFFGGGTIYLPNVLKSGDFEKIISIEQWGAIKNTWNSSSVTGVFRGCTYLVEITATATMLRDVVPTNMFRDCINLEYIKDLSTIKCVQAAPNSMFRDNKKLNQSLETLTFFEDWSPAFQYGLNNFVQGCLIFDSSVKGLVRSTVITLNAFAKDCPVFNQVLEGWNTENVFNFNSTLHGCTNYDQSLANLSFKSATTALNMLNGVTLSTPNMARLIKSIARQARNTSGNEGINSNWTLTLGSGKTPPSGSISSDLTYLANSKNLTITHGGEDLHEFKFTVDTTQTGSTNNVRFTLPLIDSETYNFKVTIDSGTTNWVGTGSSFSTKYVEFSSSANDKVVIIESLGSTPTTSPLKFNFAECGDDIKKLKYVSHFGNFVGKGNSPFNGAENADILNGAQWPYLPQEAAESSYFTGFPVTLPIPNIDLYEFTS